MAKSGTAGTAEKTATTVRKVEVIETGEIDPRELHIDWAKYNGRRYAPSKITEMAVSLLENGQQQPIQTVRDGVDGRMRVNLGHRRALAGCEINDRQLTDKVFTLRYELVEAENEDAFINNYIENVDREDLSAVDHAHNLDRLRKPVEEGGYGMSQKDIAARLNRSDAWVSRMLTLVTLPKKISKAIADGKVTQEQGFDLASMEDADSRNMEFDRIIGGGRTSSDTRQATKKKRGKSRGENKTLTGKQARSVFEEEAGRVKEGEEPTKWQEFCEMVVKMWNGQLTSKTFIKNARGMFE
jgi:ParB family chromosome partitioning protein